MTLLVTFEGTAKLSLKRDVIPLCPTSMRLVSSQKKDPKGQERPKNKKGGGKGHNETNAGVGKRSIMKNKICRLHGVGYSLLAWRDLEFPVPGLGRLKFMPVLGSQLQTSQMQAQLLSPASPCLTPGPVAQIAATCPAQLLPGTGPEAAEKAAGTSVLPPSSPPSSARDPQPLWAWCCSPCPGGDDSPARGGGSRTGRAGTHLRPERAGPGCSLRQRRASLFPKYSGFLASPEQLIAAPPPVTSRQAASQSGQGRKGFRDRCSGTQASAGLATGQAGAGPGRLGTAAATGGAWAGERPRQAPGPRSDKQRPRGNPLA